jgi:hypothetical protein
MDNEHRSSHSFRWYTNIIKFDPTQNVIDSHIFVTPYCEGLHVFPLDKGKVWRNGFTNLWTLLDLSIANGTHREGQIHCHVCSRMAGINMGKPLVLQLDESLCLCSGFPNTDPKHC